MMKSDRCIEELENIIEIEGISGNNGVITRREALKRWINEWVVELKYSQPIIKKGLTLDEEEFIRYYAAYKLGDELMNECIYLDSTETGLNTRVLALKR